MARFASLFFLLVLASAGLAQKDIRFKRVTTEAGKNIVAVRCFLYDSHGYMWMGSEDSGFIRFDGTRAREYTSDELRTDQFNSTSVWLIFEDQNRQVWIGTNAGALMKYNRYLDRFELMNDSTSSSPHQLYSWAADELGNFWIGSLGGGLYYYNPETRITESFKSNPQDTTSLYDNYVTGLAFDHTGKLWIGTTGGLCSYDKKTKSFQRHQLTNVNPGDTYRYRVIRSLTFASDHALYVSTYGGLHKIDLETGRNDHFIHDDKNKNSLSSNSLFNAIEDLNGKIWIGTHGGGLNLFDPVSKKFTHWKRREGDQESLSSNNIFSIYYASNGLLWIGAADNTVNLYHSTDKPFHTIQHAPGNLNSLSSGWVRSIMQEDDSIYWIGFNGSGLNRLNLNTGKVKSFVNDPNNPKSLGHNAVVGLDQDSRKNIWIGLEGGGINSFDKRTGTFTRYTYNTSNSISNNAVSALIVDQDDRVWAATYRSGINVLDTRQNRFYQFSEDSLKNQGISFAATFDIRELSNSLWFNTRQGIIVFDKQSQQFVKIADEGVLSTTKSMSLIDMKPYSESEMLLFTATDIQLVSYKNANNIDIRTIHSLKQEDGKILSFVVDHEKLIWYVTKDHLVRLNLQTKEWKKYTKEDGLLNIDFGTLTIDNSGRIFIGSRDGINWFYPKEITDDATPCRLVFNDFQLYNHPVKIQTIDSITHFLLPGHISQLDEITLTHDQSFFSVGFGALEYVSPLKIQYAYRLDGFDHDWVHVGNRNFASYTNLDPGQYKLQVKASNPDGYWSEPISLSIKIEPPFWRTAWFMVMVFITTLGLIYFIHRYRIAQLLKIERLRTKIASDLHDEVGSSLTRISIYSDLLKNEKDDTERSNYLQRINTVSREVVSTMSDIVWSIDNRSDSAESLFLRMKEYSAEVLSSKGIESSFQISGISEKSELEPLVRQNIYLIFKESITNVVKHAQAQHVTIEISQNSEEFSMIISDDGVGFDSSVQNQGHGLRSMQRRAFSIDGTIEFANSAGSQIIFRRKI